MNRPLNFVSFGRCAPAITRNRSRNSSGVQQTRLARNLKLRVKHKAPAHDDPLTCYRTSLPVLHIPSRRSGIRDTPITDPVYPGWSYETDGQGPSGRTDYAANDQVFCTTYAGWGKVLMRLTAFVPGDLESTEDAAVS